MQLILVRLCYFSSTILCSLSLLQACTTSRGNGETQHITTAPESVLFLEQLIVNNMNYSIGEVVTHCHVPNCSWLSLHNLTGLKDVPPLLPNPELAGIGVSLRTLIQLDNSEDV